MLCFFATFLLQLNQLNSLASCNFTLISLKRTNTIVQSCSWSLLKTLSQVSPNLIKQWNSWYVWFTYMYEWDDWSAFYYIHWLDTKKITSNVFFAFYSLVNFTVSLANVFSHFSWFWMVPLALSWPLSILLWLPTLLRRKLWNRLWYLWRLSWLIINL